MQITVLLELKNALCHALNSILHGPFSGVASMIWNQEWSQLFKAKASQLYSAGDSSHDITHIERVVRMSHYLSGKEGADISIVMPAAWLHDVGGSDKSSMKRRKAASTQAGLFALKILSGMNYPDEGRYAKIQHAIETHSFSANIPPHTIEAKVVQDADRLDSLGWIGIVRTAITGGVLRTPLLYNESDLYCEKREPNDSVYLMDHFWSKLMKLPELLNTDSAKVIGEERVQAMNDFLNGLRKEAFFNRELI